MAKLYQTYTDAANAYLKENSIHQVQDREILKAFAKYLDGFRVADDKLSIAALQGARKIDRETILALVDELGIERSRDIIKSVTAKHRHYSQWQDQNVEGTRLFAWITWKLRKVFPSALKWGITQPTDSLPKDKEDQLNEIRTTSTKNS